MSITIERSQATGLQQTIRIRHHQLTADADAAVGGEDAGPQPHDLYDAAIGACKALTVLIYAQRRGYPLEDVALDIDRDDSQERQGLYRLKATLRLTGALDEAQRQDLLRVAGKCPVQKLVTAGRTEVETVLAP